MKKFNSTFIIYVLTAIVAILLLVFDIVSTVRHAKPSGEEKTAKADGFTIDSYNVVLDVQEDNTINVTEKVTVNWYSTNHHGIYKFTPQWLEYTDRDGKTIKRKSKISNLRAVGDQYTVDTVKKKSRIKIGSPDKYVEKGLKTYTIAYTYDMGKDPYKGFDEFIFYAFGDYWGTEIKNASITVNMPKSIEGCTINFFTDKYRENCVNDYVNYTVTGNTLVARFDSSKYFEAKGKTLGKSLTVDIELPEGYFKGAHSTYGFGSLIFCICIFALTFYTYKIWHKYGKNFAAKVDAIEYGPPDGLSSAEIGYIYNKWQPSKKLTISLILSLAAKGHIKINEIGKKKHIEITKTESTVPLNDYEKYVYSYLFEEKDTVLLNEHKTFYKSFSEVSSALYKNYKDKMYDKEANSKRKKSILMAVITMILSLISYFGIEDLNPKFSILYYLSFGCIFVNLFFTIIMGRKTKYGEQIIARVSGFRKFLETAEKEQLEALVEQEPHYFYKILPYTYVLDISKTWIRKFENIPMPEVDIGNFNYMSTSDSYFYSLYSDTYQPPVTYSSSGGSGCSSCGGGCSSCGGGCSSCGGGGSW